jgi:hypothetical protein
MSLNTPEPQPKPSDGPAIWDLVIADMRERDRIGTAKYGQRLKAGDARNSLVDAYQEVLDLAVYLRKAIYEQQCGLLSTSALVCQNCGGTYGRDTHRCPEDRILATADL